MREGVVWVPGDVAGLAARFSVVGMPVGDSRTGGGSSGIAESSGGASVPVFLAVSEGLMTEPPRGVPLTDDDHWRAGRLQVEADRRRFWTGRALVHALTERVCGDVTGWEFVAPEVKRGTAKPRWVAGDASGETTLPSVSISHAGDVVLVGLCADAEVGVDVESVGAVAALDDAALAVLFRPDERAAFGGAHDVAEAFTAKEAVLKAGGVGFGADPLDVRLGTGGASVGAGSAGATADGGQPFTASVCALSLPELARDYAAHVALTAW